MHAVSGQTLEVEMNELTQGLKDIRRDICEISSQERIEDDHFEAVMNVSIHAHVYNAWLPFSMACACL